MAATTTPPQAAPVNRRRRFRHKVRTPAYASFIGESKGIALDLNAISDISEDGLAIDVNSLETGRRLELHLDLAESSGPIYTTGEVIWSVTGRCGFRFAELPPASLFRLRSWLFLNAMTAVADSQSTSDRAQLVPLEEEAAPRQNYSDTLAALAAVQREVETLGSDLVAALQLIAVRAQTLVRASGAAIALSAENHAVMICRASSGVDAPPVGAELQVGSGFSGECVRAGKPLRCDDAETDIRVDRASCRSLGIRSILAAPVRVGSRVIGLIEAFAPQPNTFSDSDGVVLQRLADAVLVAVNSAARAEDLEVPASEPAQVATPPASVAFSSEAISRHASSGRNHDNVNRREQGDAEAHGGIHLPQYHLIVLMCTAGLIAGVIAGTVGFIGAPWIQSTAAPWIRAKLQAHQPGQVQTVLASAPTRNTTKPTSNAVDTATLAQLRQLATAGDPLAQNALGLHYAQGEGVKLDEQEAAAWFTKAAEQGNVAAQSKLGSLYWAGRGVPASLKEAYFWTVLARAGGDKGSKELAKIMGDHMTRAQAAQIEQDANTWLQDHQTPNKR